MLTKFLVDFEDILDQEKAHEQFKQTLLQAYPEAMKDIYKEEHTEVPDWAEQRAPSDPDEVDELAELFSMLGEGKTMSLDQLLQ